MVETIGVREHSRTNKRKVRFEMKLTLEEKQQIELLSQREGKPAKRVIMRLVQRALQQTGTEKLSAKEMIALSPGARKRVMAKQFQKAEQLYKEDSELIVSDVDIPRKIVRKEVKFGK